MSGLGAIVAPGPTLTLAPPFRIPGPSAATEPPARFARTLSHWVHAGSFVPVNSIAGQAGASTSTSRRGFPTTPLPRRC